MACDPRKSDTQISRVEHGVTSGRRVKEVPSSFSAAYECWPSNMIIVHLPQRTKGRREEWVVFQATNSR